MTSDAEYAARRELIRKLFTPVYVQQQSEMEQRQCLLACSHVGFGFFDEDEYTKRETHRKCELARLDGSIDRLHWCKTLILDTFGRAEVEHAIEEGEQRIGQLPYVD